LLELASSGHLPSGARLRTLRGKRMTVQSDDTVFHRDGSLIEGFAKAVEFSCAVKPEAVRYLR
jgi:hypothetical protein